MFLKRQSVNTGTQWEDVCGFSRALRLGDRIFVSGTTATGPSGVVGKDDPGKQMLFILNRIEQAIEDLGGSIKDVVRTRIYVSNLDHWEIVAKIHGEKFQMIRPACTLVEARLMSDCLVEVEAEAIVGAHEYII